MNGALIGALLVTSVITAGTPGPNNFIVLTARLSDTTAAALRVYLGVCLGFPAMVFVVSLAVAHYGEAIIDQLTIIKYLGVGFLLYLAVKLFLAAPSDLSGRTGTAASIAAVTASAPRSATSATVSPVAGLVTAKRLFCGACTQSPSI
jgi:threonine/homoserine/homoserine lactone efflux protein